jgi:hypothetical protein
VSNTFSTNTYRVCHTAFLQVLAYSRSSRRIKDINGAMSTSTVICSIPYAPKCRVNFFGSFLHLSRVAVIFVLGDATLVARPLRPPSSFVYRRWHDLRKPSTIAKLDNTGFSLPHNATSDREAELAIIGFLRQFCAHRRHMHTLQDCIPSLH